MAKHRLELFENEVPMKVFGPKVSVALENNDAVRCFRMCTLLFRMAK